MNKLIYTLILSFIFIQMNAQESTSRKAVYLELLGNGLTFSLNFDYMLDRPEKNNWSFRGGVGGGNLSGSDLNGNNVNVDLYTFPLSAQYLVGNRRGFFETGAGITPVYADFEGIIDSEFFDESGFTLLFFGNIGYRWQAYNNGLFFKINLHPAVTNEGFFPLWAGLSLGYSFR